MMHEDELLQKIHELIRNLGEGTTDTLLELLQRIVAAETLALALQAQERRLWQDLRTLRLLVWGVIVVEGMFVLFIVIATLVQIVR